MDTMASWYFVSGRFLSHGLCLASCFCTCWGLVPNNFRFYAGVRYHTRVSLLQEILQERERAQQHIWEFRTPEEAGKHWKEEFGHLQD